MYSVNDEIREAFDRACGGYETPGYSSYSDDDKLAPLDSEEIANKYFERKDFLVDSLLTTGLCMLAGAPKIGKSWLVLHLCLCIAKGEPFLGLPVRQSEVLYLALEDDGFRIHRRLNTVTEVSSEKLYITNTCAMMGEKLFWQLERFKEDHPDLRLVVIDTLQMIRPEGKETSYSGDYDEMAVIKALADRLRVCILLVHHTRKMPDTDFVNVISGSSGISGSCDTVMVLQKEKRTSREATLSCTGRDIEDRELKLKLDRDTCIWKVTSDSLTQAVKPIPPEIRNLISYVRQNPSYAGTNTEFTEQFKKATGVFIRPSQLKRLMNLHVEALEDNGVIFASQKIHGERKLIVKYEAAKDRALIRSEVPPRKREPEPPAREESAAGDDDGRLESLLNCSPPPEKPSVNAGLDEGTVILE